MDVIDPEESVRRLVRRFASGISEDFAKDVERTAASNECALAVEDLLDYLLEHRARVSPDDWVAIVQAAEFFKLNVERYKSLRS